MILATVTNICEFAGFGFIKYEEIMTKERPILLNGEMVRATIEGRKTQTRRIVKPQPNPPNRRGFDPVAYAVKDHNPEWWWMKFQDDPGDFITEYSEEIGACPYGQPGDRLWVRETFGVMPGTLDEEKQFVYRADCPLDIQGWPARRGAIEDFIRWRPSIHMPRIASRLILEITNIRVERLNDISAEDALAEGVEWGHFGWRDYLNAERRKSSAKQSFQTLWESINGAGSWEANPWVWVIEEKKFAKNKNVGIAPIGE